MSLTNEQADRLYISTLLTFLHPSYVPYTPEKEAITSCGVPQQFNASEEFANKKVVLFAVPGMYLPSVSELCYVVGGTEC